MHGICGSPTNTVGEESILLGVGDEEVLNTTFLIHELNPTPVHFQYCVLSAHEKSGLTSSIVPSGL